MEELFYENGHLTPYALNALTADIGSPPKLSELERLELAEHLSFCDHCLAAYTELLGDSLLISPPTIQAEAIMLRVKNKARLLFINRYARVSVAACLAITLWASGVFSLDYFGEQSRLQSVMEDKTTSISQQVSEWKENVSKEFVTLLFNTTHKNNNLKGVSSNEQE